MARRVSFDFAVHNDAPIANVSTATKRFTIFVLATVSVLAVTVFSIVYSIRLIHENAPLHASLQKNISDYRFPSNWIEELNDTQTTEPPAVLVNRFRLPRDLVPRHYEVQLLPWIEDDKLDSPRPMAVRGSVRILIECLRETDRIVLHSHDIQLGSVQVQTTILLFVIFFLLYIFF